MEKGLERTQNIERLIETARASRKYAVLCPSTLERMARRAADRYPKYAQALDAYKASLHQLAGSYITPEATRMARRWLEEDASCDDPASGGNPASGGDPAGGEAADGEAVDGEATETATETETATKALCARVLALHASSRERLNDYEALYREIWAVTGAPERLLDLACGLNPFSLPWMNAPIREYRACDVHGATTELCNALFRRLGLPEGAECRDVLDGFSRQETEDIDVALCQKLLPLLEHQERGSAARMLSELRSRWLVVSYPLKSLGGREKGMAEHYRVMAQEQIPACWVRRAERVIGSEWLLFCERDG